MSTIDWIGNQLRRYALNRFRRFASVPLEELKAPSNEFCSVPDSLVTFLCQNQDSVVRWMDERSDETSQFFIKQAIAFFQTKNQFLIVGDQEKTILTAEYVRFLGDFRSGLLDCKHSTHLPKLLKEVLAVHQIQLEQFVLDLASRNLSRDFVFSTPVCSEYSPDLQLRILHTPTEHLLDPILDLGCGQNGELVHFLRSQGNLAFGVDRGSDPDQFIINADWFNFPFVPGFWGTIISHMAFSNHFLHHYLRPSGHLQQYAQCYMDVLSALKPQGSFIYAPGLPFIEALLPREEYCVERFEITQMTGTRINQYFRTTYGLDVLYACKVTRSC